MSETMESARCAAHPMQAAAATCERCGNYMCVECNEGGQVSSCPPCRQRTGASAFPFNRANFDLGQVLSFSVDRFKEQWVPLSLAALIILGTSMIVSGVNQGIQMATMGGVSAAGADPMAALAGMGVVSFAISICGMILQLWLQLGLHSICLKTLQGFEADLADLFRQGPRLLAAVAQIALIYLALIPVFGIPAAIVFGIGAGFESMGVAAAIAGGIFVILFLPIAVYVGLGLFGMQIELVGDPSAGPIEAMKRSWAIASGYRLNIFLYMLVASVLMFAGILACCVGLIPAMGLMTLMLNAVYLALRTGADI